VDASVVVVIVVIFVVIIIIIVAFEESHDGVPIVANGTVHAVPATSHERDHVGVGASRERKQWRVGEAQGVAHGAVGKVDAKLRRRMGASLGPEGVHLVVGPTLDALHKVDRRLAIRGGWSGEVVVLTDHEDQVWVAGGAPMEHGYTGPQKHTHYPQDPHGVVPSEYACTGRQKHTHHPQGLHGVTGCISLSAGP
jgi:hypothetical protein